MLGVVAAHGGRDQVVIYIEDRKARKTLPPGQGIRADRAAMDLLAHLSDGKRTIGVISHVAELRERIEKKIYVYHTQRGSQLRLEY